MPVPAMEHGTFAYAATRSLRAFSMLIGLGISSLYGQVPVLRVGRSTLVVGLSIMTVVLLPGFVTTASVVPSGLALGDGNTNLLVLSPCSGVPGVFSLMGPARVFIFLIYDRFRWFGQLTFGEFAGNFCCLASPIRSHSSS